jgi:phosphoserine phosphatase RsbU/P
MPRKINSLTKSRGLENAILVSIILFLFNLIFPLHESPVLSIINEVLVFLTIFFLYNYIHLFLSSKLDSPLTLVLNAGILGALVFFIVSIANVIFGNGETTSIGFFDSLFSILIVFVFITAIVYIFSTFRVLFFLRQKKDPGTYFNTMLIFLALSFFSNIFTLFDTSLDYPRDAFYVVTIVLICLNSVRVSWIAFLPKRQKYYLLVIAVVLSILFGFDFAMIGGNGVVKKMLYAFSPGVHAIIHLVMIYGCIYFAVIFFTTLFHLPTAEAFDRKAAEVSSLMDLTKLITQVFDFKELGETITLLTTRICNSDAAWLITKKDNEIELRSVHNIGFVDANNITKNIFGTGDTDFESLEIVQYDAINSNAKQDGHNFRSIAVAPLKVHGKINGYLFAARSKENNFDPDEKKSVEAYADYASVALENAKLIEESFEKERLEKELDVARDIQSKILPSKVPTSKQLEVSALFVPAFEVGGDYYDFFELDNDRLGFVVADVSGKGISAAFIMAEVKGIFESLSKIIYNPRELLVKVNDILKGSLDKKNFVTAIYGVIDRKKGILNIARAGHTPAILCRGEQIEHLQPAGIGLGLDYSSAFSASIKELEIELKNNDIVICYSDGIPEAKNHLEEDFGYEKLDALVLANRNNDLDAISNSIMKELSLFSKNHSQHDDITLVIFRWKQNN